MTLDNRQSLSRTLPDNKRNRLTDVDVIREQVILLTVDLATESRLERLDGIDHSTPLNGSLS